MKSRAFTLIAAMTFFIVLTTPIRVSAQQHKGGRPRYKLIDLGTLGGPNSSENIQSPILNNEGVVVGFSDTSIPCVIPDCFFFHAFRWRKGILSDLGTLPDGDNSVAFGINTRGQTIGQSENGLINPLAGGAENRAVLWKKDGQIIDLGTLGGNDSRAFAINDEGQIVGGALNDVPDPFSMPGLGQQARAFLWQKGAMRDLGTLGGPDSFAALINDRGQVVGVSYPDTNPTYTCFMGFLLTTHPFLWQNGTMVDLGTLGGTCAGPAKLNNRGQVAGTSNLAGDLTFHPFLWDGETLKDLGTLGGSVGFGNSLNEAGDVVGVAATTGDEAAHAFFWRNGVMTDLGTINDDPCSVAHAINARGQVVGATFDCDQTELHGFLWQPGGPMIDLNAFVPPGSDLIVTSGETINQRGEIAGTGMLPNGDFHAIVLIPSDDEPDNEGCHGTGQNANATSSGPAPLLRGSAAQSSLSPTKIVNALGARFAHRYHIPSRGTPRK
jgi:probable HAF family extracellular repeat protein